MAKTVWKYPLMFNGATRQDVMLPRAAMPLHFDMQDGKPTMWVLCDPEKKPLEVRSFIVCGTGAVIYPEAIYRGTCLENGGVYVWHLFEILNPKGEN